MSKREWSALDPVAVSRIRTFKHCSKCGELKPSSEFPSYRYVTNQGKQSLRSSSLCRPCLKAKSDARPRKTDRRWSEWRRQSVKSSDPTKKICYACRKEKPLTEFGRHRLSKDGHRFECFECRMIPLDQRQPVKRADPRYHLARKVRRYGLTVEQYDQMLKDQDGKCLGCLRVMERPCVDHCHTTGKVRGLLCVPCNSALGMVEDNIETLSRLSKYLTENGYN